MNKGNLHIGTSGWSYQDWIGAFYPDGTAKKDLLQAYTQEFDTVEVNNSFYHLPAVKTIENWRDHTPQNFLFAVKANRYITHMKKLKSPRQSLEKQEKHFHYFRGKQGPVLFQLPPNWNVNTERLEAFLSTLPEGRHVFEFRDESWLCDDVFKLLKDSNSALCIYDMKGEQSVEKVTADFVYLRLHGPNQQAYTGSYPKQTLKKYARKINDWRADELDVFVYFDNDKKSCAPFDARELKDLCG